VDVNVVGILISERCFEADVVGERVLRLVETDKVDYVGHDEVIRSSYVVKSLERIYLINFFCEHLIRFRKIGFVG